MKMKTVKIYIPIALSLISLTLFSLAVTNNFNCTKFESGSVNQGPGSIHFGMNNSFYGPAIVNGKEYLTEPDVKRDVKFYPKEKILEKAKTAVISKGFSVDEIIAKTPICVYEKVRGECPAAVCLTSSSLECQEREDRMELDNVITHATNPTPNYWNIRAKGFYLLGHAKNEMLKDKQFRFPVTWEIILDTISNAINNEPNIFVRREALKAFDKLTDFNRKDDFDFGSASKWWETAGNKEKAIEKLINK